MTNEPSFQIRWYVLLCCALFSIALMSGIAGIGYWIHGKQGAILAAGGSYILMVGIVVHSFVTAQPMEEDFGTEN